MKKCIQKRLIEYLLPSFVAWRTNRGIREKNRDSLSNYWKQTLTTKDIPSLDKLVDGLYHSEIQRKDTIESKAASLFEAIGFAASLVSIAIVFMEKSIALILLLFPLANFILAGICSWHATKIGEFFLLTLEGIKEDIELLKKKTKDERELHWVIEKLVSTEMNYPSILMKSNWLTASHQHFLLGTLSIIPIFIVIILVTFFL